MPKMILNGNTVGGVASDASKVNYGDSTVEEKLNKMTSDVSSLNSTMKEELDYVNIVNLTTGYTSSNPFIVPKKGIILACSGSSTTGIFDIDLNLIFLRVYTSDSYVTNTAQVYKGQRLRVDSIGTYGYAKFIPFK